MSNRFYIYVLALCLVAVGLSSCNNVDYRPAPEPERVLLVYVGTDNNLAGLEQAKIQALRDGWTGKKNDRIIVYRDTRNADARLIEISNLADGEAPRELGRYGDSDIMSNSASSQTLHRVITDVRAMFPNAESFGLLVFSHASGWLPEGVFGEFEQSRIPEAAININAKRADTRSIIVDGNDEMSLKDFAVAIPDGIFDYIAFEACFMAGIEVVYELRNKASYILASSAEIVDPGFAPIYAVSGRKLLANNLSGFGQDAMRHTMTYSESDPQRSATYSVIRTSGLEQLAQFIADKCNLSRLVEVADIQRFDRLKICTMFFDFKDYYARLLDTDTEREELARLISDCIIWKDSTPQFMTQSASYNGFNIKNHSGMTTYIPQAKFAGLNSEYEKLEWTMSIRQ